MLRYDSGEPARLLHHTGVLHRLVEDLRTLSLADADADADTGIPAADRSRVFDRFTQLDPARQSPGNGLGPAIVHAHDGTVAIDDAPDGGTRATVCLPLKP